MDGRIIFFYRQYLQQIPLKKLSFPPDHVLLDPLVQFQISRFMFASHFLFPSDGEAGLFLPRPSYQKRVLKELIRRIEAAIRNPDEDEISNDLMGKMAELYTKVDPLPVDAAAQMKSILTYSLPCANDDLVMDPVLIEEYPNLLASGGATGFRTWDACLHLATYLTTEGRFLVTGKSVLELGVGTGLLSIICAGRLSAAYVLATDGDSAVDRTMARNISLNDHLSRDAGHRIPLASAVLVWGSSAALGTLHPSNGADVFYDTILGADITYSPDSLEPLASTLNCLAELCPKTQIVISATIRNEDTFDKFLTCCLEKGLGIYDVDFRCPPYEIQKGLFHSHDPPIRIVKIKKER